MACTYRDGVIVAADSRTTTGAYIANRATNKLTPLAERVYVCRSGSAADTQAVSDVVKRYLAEQSMEAGSLPRVKTAAALLKKMSYENKNNLLCGFICGGWDPVDGGQVYSIPLGGSLVRQDVAIGGSGSTFIWGYIDANWKPGMSYEEAEAFVRNAVALAMTRDGSSGGLIRMVKITKDGAERKMIPGNKVPFTAESEGAASGLF